jgi:hypothetical protein
MHLASLSYQISTTRPVENGISAVATHVVQSVLSHRILGAVGGDSRGVGH